MTELPPGPDLPVACDLGALDEARRARRELLEVALQSGTAERVELANGWAFHLRPGSLIARSVDELVALERVCCPFLHIDVERPRRGGRPVLRMGGSAEAKTFVAARFAAAGPAQDCCPS